MKFINCSVVLVASMIAAPHALACFTVYNQANQVVYSGAEPPIDMSYQIHQRLPAVFPGGHLVFGLENECPNVDLRRTSSVARGYVTASTGRPQQGRGARADRN